MCVPVISHYFAMYNVHEICILPIKCNRNLHNAYKIAIKISILPCIFCNVQCTWNSHDIMCNPHPQQEVTWQKAKQQQVLRPVTFCQIFFSFDICSMLILDVDHLIKQIKKFMKNALKLPFKMAAIYMCTCRGNPPLFGF